jgi:hypothetical protein
MSNLPENTSPVMGLLVNLEWNKTVKRRFLTTNHTNHTNEIKQNKLTFVFLFV